MQLSEITPRQAPWPLLLEADPSEDRIRSYLADAWCFASSWQETFTGVCVVGVTEPGTAELYNIAVDPATQAQGVGSALLAFTLEQLRNRGITRVELGTGSFGHQLVFYQRHGFRVYAVERDHFITHYPEKIFERGLQHKDGLRLACDLSDL